MGRILALWLCALAAPAADYFPLQTGNQWTYVSGLFGQSFTVEVTGTEDSGGITYFVVQGFPNGVMRMRLGADGAVYLKTADGEAVWAAFGAPAGNTYDTGISSCNAKATLRSFDESADVPAGHFDKLVAIDYPPALCADAGITSELYLDGVGLLQRTQTSIAGPLTYDLVSARVNGGVTQFGIPEQSFTAALDRTVYATGATALARLAYRNTQAEPRVLTFPTGQRFDALIRNSKGELVYQWSNGKAFTLSVGLMPVTGEKTWVFTFPMPDVPGSYTVELSLASEGAPYRAQLAVDVQ